jgi:hypothetical protein
MSNFANLRATSMGAIIPKTFFGTHIVSLNGWLGYTTPYKDLGQGAIRLWDTGTSARRIINESGVYDWSRLDALVTIAQNNGLEILFTLGSLPLYMTSGTGPATGSYNPNPPSDMQYWIDYCTAVLTRYKGKIKKYEVWNEIDLAQFWVGTIDQMAQMTSLLVTVRDTVDPNAKIVAASCSSYANATTEPYLKQCVNLVDEISTHIYVQPREPEVCGSLISAVRGSSLASTKPLIVTEGTWNNYYENGVLKTGDNNPMLDTQAAAYVSRMYLTSWLNGATQMFFYAMDNFGFNNIRILDQSTKTITQPAGQAFLYLATLLTGGNLYGVSGEASFRTRDGRTGKVFWTADGVTKTKDLSSYSSGTDVLGNAITLSPSYTVTNSPIFVFN